MKELLLQPIFRTEIRMETESSAVLQQNAHSFRGLVGNSLRHMFSVSVTKYLFLSYCNLLKINVFT